MVESVWPHIIFASVCIAIMLTLIIIPQVRDIAFKKNLFDKPDRRKVHQGIVPRLGGFAFLPVILISFCSVIGLCLSFSLTYIFQDIEVSLPAVLILFASMMALFVGGFCDDLVGIRYIKKFFVQAFCGLITVFAGIYIVNFETLFGLGKVNPILSYFLTFFLIIYIINSINLIDGIDGLASGIAVITLGVYGYCFYVHNLLVYSMLSFTAGASVAVFFCFNFFGKEESRKKIFMGDIGSLTIGMFIAFMSIQISNIPIEGDAKQIRPLILAFSPLVIPLFDVIRVFCVRIMLSKSPFLPDKNHIHHNLLSLGLSSHSVLYILLASQIFFIAFNLIFSKWLDINIILGIDIAIYIIGYCIIYRRRSVPQAHKN